MRNMGAAGARAVGTGPSLAEAWVHEKGLPRTCWKPLVDHLGHRLLLATDLSEAAHHVEARAIELAERAGASLLILAIHPPGTSLDARSARRLRARIRLARRRGIRAEGSVVMGDPAAAILQVAAATGAHTIVIGADQWRGWPPGGCACGHILRHASCPVLVVQASGAA